MQTQLKSLPKPVRQKQSKTNSSLNTTKLHCGEISQIASVLFSLRIHTELYSYTETRSCCCCNPFHTNSCNNQTIRKPSKKLTNTQQHSISPKQQIKRKWLCRHRSPLIWGWRASKVGCTLFFSSTNLVNERWLLGACDCYGAAEGCHGSAV